MYDHEEGNMRNWLDRKVTQNQLVCKLSYQVKSVFDAMEFCDKF